MIVFVGLPIVYIASLLYRRRNLKRDEEVYGPSATATAKPPCTTTSPISITPSAAAMTHLKQAVALFAEVGGEAAMAQPEIWKLTDW